MPAYVRTTVDRASGGDKNLDCGSGGVAGVRGFERTKLRTMERAAVWAKRGELHRRHSLCGALVIN